jgi:hypothetical protein
MMRRTTDVLAALAVLLALLCCFPSVTAMRCRSTIMAEAGMQPG